MIDIEEDGVKLLAGDKPRRGLREREKVTVQHRTAGVGCKRWTKGHEALLVPADRRLEVLDDNQRTEIRVGERRERRVAQAKSADDDVAFGAGQLTQPEIGHRI